MPLPFENVALPLVLFKLLVELVERGERPIFEQHEPLEALQLVVDLVALRPQRLEIDRHFEPPCPGRDLFRRLLPIVDVVRQLAHLHGRLCPPPALHDQLRQLALQLIAPRNQRPNLRRLIAGAQQPQPRAASSMWITS